MADRPSGPVPRVYTVPELFADLGSVLTRAPALWAIWIGGRLPRALREQIIVAVAKVNACRMCEHAHTSNGTRGRGVRCGARGARGHGPSAFDRRTWLAIAHARERTKANFAPVAEDASQEALSEALSAQTRSDVEDVARVMTVANRIANTLNALPDRWRGKPVPGESHFRRARHQLPVLARRLAGHARGCHPPAKVAVRGLATGSGSLDSCLER